jgi:hypothetical protein
MDDHHLSTISRNTKQQNEQQTHNFWQQQHSTCACTHPRTQEGIAGFPNMELQVLISRVILNSITLYFISFAQSCTLVIYLGQRKSVQLFYFFN